MFRSIENECFGCIWFKLGMTQNTSAWYTFLFQGSSCPDKRFILQCV